MVQNFVLSCIRGTILGSAIHLTPPPSIVTSFSEAMLTFEWTTLSGTDLDKLPQVSPVWLILHEGLVQVASSNLDEIARLGNREEDEN